MTKTPISAVIITKNEEDKIKRCLDSINWVDEVIVVDDQSSDKTLDICREYNTKIIINKSNGNFRDQRNLGSDNAKNDWVLQLDADEIIPYDLKEKIIEALNKQDNFVAFSFKRKNFFLGHFIRYSGEYNDTIKLFKKNKARYVGRTIHEILEVNGPIAKLNADIEHYPFKSITQFIERQNFYSSLEAREILQEKGMLREKEIRYNLTIKPLKLFFKLYFKKQGFKDGMYGLVWCLMQVTRRIFIWVKYWELIK